MCTLIRYLGFVGFFFFFELLNWMFEHGCVDTCCFGCHMHVFCICVFAPVQRH